MNYMFSSIKEQKRAQAFWWQKQQNMEDNTSNLGHDAQNKPPVGEAINAPSTNTHAFPDLGQVKVQLTDFLGDDNLGAISGPILEILNTAETRLVALTSTEITALISVFATSVSA